MNKSSPKCFISYSWDSEKHKEWVRTFAKQLMENGVDVNLDQWDTYLGIDLLNYMETCIRESDYTLLVCTRKYANKANLDKGGVGYEKCIVTGEIFQKVASKRKFIPIIREGELSESTPSFIKSRLYIDFRNDDNFKNNFEKLLRHIYKSPKYVKPSLGKKPVFTQKETIEKKKRKRPSLVTLKALYNFAYTSSGMNKSRSASESFSKKWIKEYSNKDLAIFRKAYMFAYTVSGLNKSRIASENFAWKWIEDHSNKDLAIFREAYMYAYTVSGLNKSRSASEKFAWEYIT